MSMNIDILLKSFLTSLLLNYKSTLHGVKFESDPDLTKIMYLSDPTLREIVDRATMAIGAMFYAYAYLKKNKESFLEAIEDDICRG